MFGKSGKLASVLFVVVMLLPLLGLMIMDYQTRVANDITGAYSVSAGSAYLSENILAGAVLVGVLVAALVLFTVGRVRKARMVHTMPLAKINEEIRKIDDHIKGGSS
jgi:hypothetical protein